MRAYAASARAWRACEICWRRRSFSGFGGGGGGELVDGEDKDGGASAGRDMISIGGGFLGWSGGGGCGGEACGGGTGVWWNWEFAGYMGGEWEGNAWNNDSGCIGGLGAPGNRLGGGMY